MQRWASWPALPGVSELPLTGFGHGTAGPRCGASVTTEIPGLLVGLAGIGYGLLRAAHPDRVPSVLLLETSVCGAPRPQQQTQQQ